MKIFHFTLQYHGLTEYQHVEPSTFFFPTELVEWVIEKIVLVNPSVIFGKLIVEHLRYRLFPLSLLRLVEHLQKEILVKALTPGKLNSLV